MAHAGDRKVVLVNGATGGIGSAIVRELARDYEVVMLGRNRGRLEARAAEAAADGLKVHQHVVDLSSAASIEDAIAQIALNLGEIYGIVHAAGDGPVAGVGDASDYAWQTTLDGKLLSAVRLLRAATPHLRDGGRVVLVNGSFHKTPHPMFVVGSAVNAALAAFGKAAATDLGRRGVRVTVLDPGAVNTPLWTQTAAQLAAYAETTADVVNRQIADSTPLGGLTTPGEVAEVVRFLLSQAGSRIAGTAITVDGGACATL
jgi:NAD(P)-dependent dehydrogenase (short-subunit alcohol dehydrogenase family)